MTADSRRCQTIIGFAPTAAVGCAVFFLAATIGMVGMLVLTRCSPTPCLVHAMTVPGAKNAFALTSASKAWNLSGLKAALAIAGPEAAVDLRAPYCNLARFGAGTTETLLRTVLT